MSDLERVLAFLAVSVARLQERRPHQDSATQRRVTDGQIRLLQALMRDLRAGAHELMVDPSPASTIAVTNAARSCGGNPAHHAAGEMPGNGPSGGA